MSQCSQNLVIAVLYLSSSVNILVYQVNGSRNIVFTASSMMVGASKLGLVILVISTANSPGSLPIHVPDTYVSVEKTATLYLTLSPTEPNIKKGPELDA